MSTLESTPKPAPVEFHRPTNRILEPIAFSEADMPALMLARSSRLIRRIAKVLFALLVVAIVLVVFAPWQQTVTGSGSVVAFNPGDRAQRLDAMIEGRIVRWGEGIFENALVKEGQLIAEIRDLDESLTERLTDQLDASQRMLEATQTSVEANKRNLETAINAVAAYDSQLKAYRSLREQNLAVADSLIAVTREKIRAEQQHLLQQQAALLQVQQDYERQKILYEEDIVSQLKYQEAKRKFDEYQAKVMQVQSYIDALQRELEAKISDRKAKVEKAQIDIDYATTQLQKANGDVAKAESEVAKAQASLNKVEKEVSIMETKIARNRQQTLVAPFDGYLVQISPNQQSGLVKKGDPICTIVPKTTDRAVQIWLDGNDAPLVEVGRHVRLQFEGWPAVQFSGWPSVAVGTFGGEVVSVDAVDNGKGKFRILIRPDHETSIWPEDRFLRQGVRTNGWVLLDTVPLWFEVWRQLNGFPPVVEAETGTATKDGGEKNSYSK